MGIYRRTGSSQYVSSLQAHRRTLGGLLRVTRGLQNSSPTPDQGFMWTSTSCQGEYKFFPFHPLVQLCRVSPYVGVGPELFSKYTLFFKKKILRNQILSLKVFI